MNCILVNSIILTYFVLDSWVKNLGFTIRGDLTSFFCFTLYLTYSGSRQRELIDLLAPPELKFDKKNVKF